MANNRLYLYDKNTNESIMLAKGLGGGWYTIDGFEEALNEWFNRNDLDGSYGNKSSLVLLTEAEHDDIIATSKRTKYPIPKEEL